RGERLPDLDPNGVARREPCLHRLPGPGHARLDLGVVPGQRVGEVAQVYGTTLRQVAKHRLGYEWRERRHQPADRRQRLVEGLVRSELVAVRLGLPEAAPGPSDVPVGQIIDE